MASTKIKVTAASNAWRSVLTVYTRIDALLSDEMQDEAALSLDWYSILLMLAQSDEGALRPSDLADAVGLSRSATTRLVDRLAEDGLVERRECGSDRRGSFVGLTRRGEDVFKRAGRIHLRGIEEHVGSHLTNDELQSLAALLDKLADGVGGGALAALVSDDDS